MTTYTFRHVDTCLPCYLDHRNRAGELMLGVPVDCNTTYQDVLDELIRELQEHEKDRMDYDAARAAMRGHFSTVPAMTAPFDANIGKDEADQYDEYDVDDAEYGEPCYAWFVLSWGNDKA